MWRNVHANIEVTGSIHAVSRGLNWYKYIYKYAYMRTVDISMRERERSRKIIRENYRVLGPGILQILS